MIQWNDTLATGHPVVDNDHKQLIQSLNELDEALKRGAGKEQVVAIIAFLNKYTREHFYREEAYMTKVGCPSRIENCAAHAALIAKLDGWVKRLEAGVNTSLVLEVYRETSQWIQGHILKVDCKLRGCKLG